MGEVLGVILDRSGTKGIASGGPHVIAGKPLLASAIEQALWTPDITRLVVLADDLDTGSWVQERGTEVLVRADGVASGPGAPESAVIHVLDQLRDRGGYEPDLVVLVSLAFPLPRCCDLQKAIETLQKQEADSLFSAYLVSGFVWRKEGEHLFQVTDEYRTGCRDAGDDLIENGSIYVFKPWVLRQFANRLGGRIAVYQMSKLESFPGEAAVESARVMGHFLTLPSSRSTLDHLAALRVLVLDFDGVMTDNRVLVGQDGREAVWCHRGDGLGISRLKAAGVDVIVLSSETNPVVVARCRKLGVECVQGCGDKLAALKGITEKRAVDRQEVAYVGNDLNDLACLHWVGLPIVVSDAVPSVKPVAHLVTSHAGGKGAVREVAEWILAAKEPSLA